MRRLPLIPLVILLLLGGCAPAEKEVLTTSVDVDQVKLAALLDEINTLTDNDLPVAEMLALAVDTPMDNELQDRYTFAYDGADEDVQIHVWREQVDWVHLYFSTSSKDLITALDATSAPYARQ